MASRIKRQCKEHNRPNERNTTQGRNRTKAGTGVDANLSTKSIGFKIPFFAVNVPFPHAVVGVKDAKVSVGAFGVKAAGSKSKKTKKSKK